MTKHTLYYTVHERSSGKLVAKGFAEECAEQMSISRNSFYAFVFRMKQNQHAKYEVLIDNADHRKAFNRRKLYTITDPKTKALVVKGTADECAAALSIGVRTFYDLVRNTNKGISKRFLIESVNRS